MIYFINKYLISRLLLTVNYKRLKAPPGRESSFLLLQLAPLLQQNIATHSEQQIELKIGIQF